MIVVADTSPINYLILIQEVDILPKMYGRVVIPQTVREELVRASAPQLVPRGKRCQIRTSGTPPRNVRQRTHFFQTTIPDRDGLYCI
jgi:predicted nucleic acid-binding protein